MNIEDYQFIKPFSDRYELVKIPNDLPRFRPPLAVAQVFDKFFIKIRSTSLTEDKYKGWYFLEMSEQPTHDLFELSLNWIRCSLDGSSLECGGDWDKLFPLQKWWPFVYTKVVFLDRTNDDAA